MALQPYNITGNNIYIDLESDNYKLQNVESTKYVGVIIDNKPKFTEHSRKDLKSKLYVAYYQKKF